MDLDRMRIAYRRGTLEAESLGDDPLAALTRWIADAADEGMIEPNAMALATVGEDGLPSLRFVLCKGVDADGIVFYTHSGSRKGEEIAATGRAAATFWWDRMERQVRLEGPSGPVPADVSDAYFASRPHGSQVGAWASPQSRELADRAELEQRFAEAAARYTVGSEVPRPPFWGGYRLRPLRIEFWQGRESRTHDRIVFTRENVEATRWSTARLAP
jgi:pyridoxamine 5'-phosphate oxidase